MAATTTAGRWPGRLPHPATARRQSFRLIGTAGEELGVGERALVRLIHRDSGAIKAEIIRRLDTPGVPRGSRIVGVFRRTRDGGEVIPADRRDKSEYQVLGHDAAGLGDDELLVVAEALQSRRWGKRVRIIERLGSAQAPGAISRMTIAAFDIPEEFPPAALAEAMQPGRSVPTGDPARRADLRGCRWSPSTATMRAISTMRSGPSPTTIPPIPAAGTSSSPSPMWRIT